jgi:hypothetical protein
MMNSGRNRGKVTADGRWVGHVARMGAKRNSCMVFVGNPEGQIPIGRPRRKWEYIETYFRKIVIVAWSAFSWLRI